MIGANKTTQQVSENRRKALKASIDKAGRTAFANYAGENYYRLTSKLNGKIRLSEVYAFYFEGKLKEFNSGKR